MVFGGQLNSNSANLLADRQSSVSFQSGMITASRGIPTVRDVNDRGRVNFESI